MRLKHSLAVLALLLCTAAPAEAQNQASTTPYYNTQTTAPTYYAPAPNGLIPVYNNGNSTPPVPIEQMVAGKNAPSFNYNNKVQPYNFGTSPTSASQGTLTPEQQAALYQQSLQQQLAAQQAAQAQQQQQQMQYGQQAPNLQSLTQYPGSPFGTAPQAPKQRRVVYKELNNPLKTPPRLFNPDQ